MVITFNNYSLNHGPKQIIKKSSFEFDSGINLILGRNGSGKTSLLKSLIEFNFQGNISIDGNILKGPNFVKKKFGFQFGPEFLTNNLTPKELLSLCADLQNIDKKNSKYKINDLLSFFEIPNSQEIQFLSYGNKKKLLISLSLLNNPIGVFWDEPFEGLDDIMTTKLINYLRNSPVEIVIISTNNLHLAEIITPKGVIINNDKTVKCFTNFVLEEIRKNI